MVSIESPTFGRDQSQKGNFSLPMGSRRNQEEWLREGDLGGVHLR